MRVQSLGQEDPLEEDMTPRSSILACKISQTALRAVHGVTKESDMTERLQQQHSSLAKKKMLVWTSAVAVELEKDGEFENTFRGQDQQDLEETGGEDDKEVSQFLVCKNG